MAQRRGTDPETEERRLRLRPGNDAVGTWLERLFDATAEVVTFGLPTLILVVLFNSAALSAQIIAAATGFIVVAAAVMRGVLRLGDGWPKADSRFSLARILYFNVVLVASLIGSNVVNGATGDNVLVVLVVAVCLGAVAAGLFPVLAAIRR